MKINIFCPACEAKHEVEFAGNPISPKEEAIQCGCGEVIDLYEFIGAVDHKMSEEENAK